MSKAGCRFVGKREPRKYQIGEQLEMYDRIIASTKRVISCTYLQDDLKYWFALLDKQQDKRDALYQAWILAEE